MDRTARHKAHTIKLPNTIYLHCKIGHSQVTGMKISDGRTPAPQNDWLFKSQSLENHRGRITSPHGSSFSLKPREGGSPPPSPPVGPKPYSNTKTSSCYLLIYISNTHKNPHCSATLASQVSRNILLFGKGEQTSEGTGRPTLDSSLTC